MGFAKTSPASAISAADLERAISEISGVSYQLTQLRQDVRAVMDEAVEGQMSPADVERVLTSIARKVATCTRRMTELTPQLGTTSAGRVFMAVANERVVDVTEYLELANLTVRRCTASASIAVTADAPGVNLKPDPLLARTPEEFNETVREYHTWAGAPSLAVMSGRCGGRPVKSTFRSALLNTGTLPKLPMVDAIVTGCGGSEEDKQLFASAWRAVKAGRTISERDSRDVQPRRLRPVDGTRGRLA